MRRREFIDLADGSAFAWLFATRAQQPAKMLPVAGLSVTELLLVDIAGPDPKWPVFLVFLQGLRVFVWLEPKSTTSLIQAGARQCAV
jgi:hypothetical protein